MAAQGDREDKKLVIQRSQLRQHGEFWHVGVSERQKLRVPFLRTVLPPEVGESARAMASTARQKRSYLHHQGEFQHQNCTVGTVHDSDHEGVVRIFVGHSYHSTELVILYYIRLYYITRHNFSYTRSVITRHNFSPTRSVIYAAQFSLYQECNMLHSTHMQHCMVFCV